MPKKKEGLLRLKSIRGKNMPLFLLAAGIIFLSIKAMHHPYVKEGRGSVLCKRQICCYLVKHV